MMSAKQERRLWALAALWTIKGLLMFGIGLGLTLAAVTAVLANQAALHERLCHPVDYMTELKDAVRAVVR